MLNIHLCDTIKRKVFLQTVINLNLVLCGVVEAWVKNSQQVMDAEVFGTEWSWFGLDRKRRRGGGLGFVVKKSLKPRVMKVTQCNNLLWIEVDSGIKWYVAVVYLIPKDKWGTNEVTISELQRTLVDFTGKGKVVVMGDFNARVGELSNSLNSNVDTEDTVIIPRSSEDKTVNGPGRGVLESLNAVGLVLLNGVGERARFTSFQKIGNSLIDFIWIHSEELRFVSRLEVVNEDKCRLSDHLFVVVTLLSLAKASK